jgi:hypothetical protein
VKIGSDHEKQTHSIPLQERPTLDLLGQFENSDLASKKVTSKSQTFPNKPMQLHSSVHFNDEHKSTEHGSAHDNSNPISTLHASLKSVKSLPDSGSLHHDGKHVGRTNSNLHGSSVKSVRRSDIEPKGQHHTTHEISPLLSDLESKRQSQAQTMKKPQTPQMIENKHDTHLTAQTSKLTKSEHERESVLKSKTNTFVLRTSSENIGITVKSDNDRLEDTSGNQLSHSDIKLGATVNSIKTMPKDTSHSKSSNPDILQTQRLDTHHQELNDEAKTMGAKLKSAGWSFTVSGGRVLLVTIFVSLLMV